MYYIFLLVTFQNRRRKQFNNMENTMIGQALLRNIRELENNVIKFIFLAYVVAEMFQFD